MPIGYHVDMLEVLEEQSNEEMSPQVRRNRAMMMAYTPSAETLKSMMDDGTLQQSLKASGLKLEQLKGTPINVYIDDPGTPRKELFAIAPQQIGIDKS